MFLFGRIEIAQADHARTVGGPLEGVINRRLELVEQVQRARVSERQPLLATHHWPLGLGLLPDSRSQAVQIRRSGC